MGGEFLKECNRTKAWLRCLRDNKKKERRGLRKRGVKIHPFQLPWIRAWFYLQSRLRYSESITSRL